MVKNFFITAWRSLSSSKVFTLLNISGLAIGVAACLLSRKEFKNGVEEKPPSFKGGIYIVFILTAPSKAGAQNINNVYQLS